jgi:hypothetical protein
VLKDFQCRGSVCAQHRIHTGYVTISSGSNMLMWLYTQCLVTVACVLVWSVCFKQIQRYMHQNFKIRSILHEGKGCPITFHAGTEASGTALPILDLSVRWVWVVSATPRPLYPRPTQIIQEDRWSSGPSAFVRKISPLPWFDPQTVQPPDDRYTDWATPAALYTVRCMK